jgi:hypothetical protein
MRRNTEAMTRTPKLRSADAGSARGDLGVSFGRRSQCTVWRLISDELPARESCCAIGFASHQQLRMAATTYAFALRENSRCARCCQQARCYSRAVWRDFFKLNASAPCKRASFDAGIFDGSSHELGFDLSDARTRARARERERERERSANRWPLRTPKAGRRRPERHSASASRLRIRTRHGQHHLRARNCADGANNLVPRYWSNI